MAKITRLRKLHTTYKVLKETLAIRSDAQTMAAIRHGLADLDAGRVITLDKLRAEIRKRH